VRYFEGKAMNISSMINIPLLISAVVVTIVGYMLLGVAPVDNQLSWTVAPFVLVIGYLVLIPLAVLTKKPKGE
jgi:hypothetical protein